MIASREKQHKERVPFSNKYKTGILPIAMVYGGNASGKTNFFKAISFAKSLVVKGTQTDSLIALDPYRLDTKKMEQPARFHFEILIDDISYELSFAVTRKSILEEKLVQIAATSEKVLYERKNGNISFHKSLKRNKALSFAFNGTRDNQLFLTNSVSQKIETFRNVYDWFKYNLELIAPDSRFEPFEQFIDEGHPLYATMNRMLSKLDTGITHLGGEEISFNNLPLPEPIKMKLREELAEGMTVRSLTEPINERIIVTRKKGELISKKLVCYHSKSDGTEIKFEMRQESDGSQRIIDLLPAFIELAATQSKKVYIIDELDRSFHTLLTQQLIQTYLKSCSTKSRAQLLFTTHDLLLMDQDLFRRDEMWITEREKAGASHLLSFSEYKDVRNDKDIRKSYLQGRLGGIPLLKEIH